MYILCKKVELLHKNGNQSEDLNLTLYVMLKGNIKISQSIPKNLFGDEVQN